MNPNEIYNEALEQYNKNDYDKSIKLLNEILQNDDSHYHSWNLLGNIFFKLNELDTAKDFFLASINKSPNFFDAYYMLGNVLFKAKLYEESIGIWKEACKIDPHFALSYANISIAYDRVNKIEEAIFYAQKALSLDNNCFEALFCLAKIYQKKRDLIKTKYYLEKVLLIEPSNTLANFDLSYVLLSLGEYKEGFERFEFRKKMENRENEYNFLPFKNYNNQTLKDKNIILYHEQGFGDNIQFIRFVNALNCKNLSIGIQNPLNRLFSYNFPNINFLSEIKSDMNFDFKEALMSLPKILDIKNISGKKYLDVNFEDLKNFKNNFINKTKFNIGLVWKASKQEKSIQLSELNSILNNKNCSFYSLQIENIDEIKDFKIEDLGSNFKDFYDTALALKSMDLFIGVDTSVTHLAGSLGIKTFLIYKSNTIDFRWVENNRKSVWYDSVEVYDKNERDILINTIEILIKEKINDM